ncbi:MAG: hypothetical protein ACTSO9_05360 [Candidatus Helarchaeota archaeon]
MKIPERMKPIVKMFPYLKEYQRILSNLFLFPEEAETEKNKQRIIKYQEQLAKKLIKNAKKSRAEGKTAKTRNIRLANKEEKKRYRKITNGLISSLRNQYFLTLLKYGTPKFKRNFLNDLGANVAESAFLTPGNLIDTIFAKKISIGENTILNVGTVILCHEFSLDDNNLYVGDVKIGNNVTILPGAIILPGVTIGDNALVGPGFYAYDVKDNHLGIGLPDSIRYPLSDDILQMISSEDRPLETLDATLPEFRKFIPRYSPFNMILLELQKSIFVPQAIRQLMLKMAGVKIGKNVVIKPDVTFDYWHPEKITIGNGSIIKGKTVFSTHEGLVGSPVKLGEIKIGKNVLVDVGSGILPGIEIGDDAELMPYTAAVTDVERGKQVEGMPAREAGETFDIKNFLMQQFGYSANIWDEIVADKKKEESLKEKNKNSE